MKATTDDPATLPKQIDDKAPPPPPPPTTIDPDVLANLNKLVSKLLPTLNGSIATAISPNYDPWKGDIVKDQAVLTIDQWPFSEVKFTASYAISNMTGLSSLVLGPLTATSATEQKSSQGGPKSTTLTYKGGMNVSAKLTKNLVATVTGKVSASYGGSAIEMKISGKATAKSVTGTAQGVFTATIDGQNACFTDLTIVQGTFKLNYQDIDVDIQGDDDIVDVLLAPLVDLIDDVFGDEIKASISHALENPLNGVLKSLMPLCTAVSKSSK